MPEVISRTHRWCRFSQVQRQLVIVMVLMILDMKPRVTRCGFMRTMAVREHLMARDSESHRMGGSAEKA